jgi:hypothetical protein
MWVPYILKWNPLQIRRLKIKLVLLYKIQHSLVAIPAELCLTSSDRRTRCIHTFRLPHTMIYTQRQSFFPWTIGDWNKLLLDVAQSNSLERFKSQLDTYTRSQLTSSVFLGRLSHSGYLLLSVFVRRRPSFVNFSTISASLEPLNQFLPDLA